MPVPNIPGSSPHTRGAHRLRDPRRLRTGIIPAYAGSTSGSRMLSARGADHPRIRGEHSHSIVKPSERGGSSPHTRGAPQSRRRPSCRSGIIPAYAGSTHHLSSRRITTGIIPAYAGSTMTSELNSRLVRDHPRIRGEHTFHSCTTSYGPGSSPHTRGARRLDAEHHHRIGIIPAYAGSTASPRFGLCWGWDHPRIRGEHSGVSWIVKNGTGSSPHTRGAHPHCSAHEGGPLDHPRIRGEHVGFKFVAYFYAGSSPHTRGAPLGVGDAGDEPGIIPAYAGSTRRSPARRIR